MKITTPCKVCGCDMLLTFGEFNQPAIHPMCDTRPVGQRGRPHPAAGNLANLAHDATLAMAAAAPTPPDSPQWAEFDRLCDRMQQVQDNTLYPPLGWAATYYSQTLGWPVFPLKPGSKTPLTRHGFHDATDNPAQVEAWWDEFPEANIGLPTGVFFDVVDVDTPVCDTNWSSMLSDGEAEGFGLAKTASGGYHLYVEAAEADAKNRASAFGQGIDYRTRGGYVVAPWSRLSYGQVWSWSIPPANKITKKGRG